MRRFALCAAACLAATPAGADSLDGVGRVTPGVGWRRTDNQAFSTRYHAQPANAGKPRAPASVGGPVVAITFAYAVTESFELGVDLFAMAERLTLTGEPTLLSATYGSLVAGRFQRLIEGLGPVGIIPSLGILVGPTLVLTQPEGGAPTEVVTQAWGATAGVRLPLGPTWGVGVDYRFILVQGSAAQGGTVNGGGHFLTLGVTYAFPPEPDRPVGL